MANTLPKRYFGLHMAPGVAEYKDKEAGSYRILVDEEAIKNMDTTFDGKPVYVHHVDEVDLHNIQAEADGYVVKSFYNKTDGKHWVEFIVVSDAGHKAIADGWRLSNAYFPKEMSGGGVWHGVEYQKKVTRGEYEHLAIVPNPRYDESIVMTPEEFKKYNNEKEIELSRLTNSKKEGKGMLSFFKKEKIENSADLESTMVRLPKSGKEITIAQLVKNMDEAAMETMANMDHHVMVGEEKMKLNELVQKHMDCKNELEEMKKKNAENPAEDEEAKKKALELAAHEEKEMKEEKKNEEDKEEKKENSNFVALKNAEEEARKSAPRIVLSNDMVNLGKKKYGSN